MEPHIIQIKFICLILKFTNLDKKEGKGKLLIKNGRFLIGFSPPLPLSEALAVNFRVKWH
ncbi:hypothetical protein B7486_50075 [cyanobacterium TDX16]|nr:hypothetical protein B7486_50075 [cyanobacterium TDX16]